MLQVERKRGTRLMLVAPLAILAVTLACSAGQSSGGETATQKPEPTEAATPEEATQEQSQSGTVSLDIKNTGSTDICEVYIAQIEDSTWGKDQLDTKKILPDETFTLTDIPEGQYDMQALDCDGNVVARATRQDLSGSDFTWTIEADTVTLTITNKSDSIGCKVFIAAPDDKYWGPNLVSGDVKINPGDSYEITGISPGTYDVRVETCSGNYKWDSSGVDLTSDATVNMNN